MTGATRGIGAHAALEIAAAAPGATMVLLVRNVGDVSWFVDEVGDSVAVHVIEADLADMGATAMAASEVARLVECGTIPAVSCLVLNAGVQLTDATGCSVDGLELTFAVNVVANHFLVRGVAPHMRPGGRIVITVSDTHFGDLRHNLGMVPGPRWQAPDILARPGWPPRSGSARAGRTAYSTSKLAGLYQVHEYARQYPELTAVGYNPGFVPGTGLARYAGPLSRAVVTHLLPALARTPLAWATETVSRHLAELVVARTAPTSGGYITRDHLEPSSVQSYDRQREHDLIAYLDGLTDTPTVSES